MSNYAIYCYDPQTGDLYAGEGHLVAVDLINRTDDDLSITWTSAGHATKAEALAAAEAHAGHDLNWSSDRADIGYDASTAYLAIAAL
jgi:hypothetical protein